MKLHAQRVEPSKRRDGELGLLKRLSNGRGLIMFSALKGSTELYDALGDVTAYNLVRDHFAFLLDRVQRNHGFVVKTVGDALMAAFSRPDDAVRAALAIEDDI